MSSSIALSVVVPAYNAARTIERAVRSVIACDSEALEVVVVDDGSEDTTYEIVAALAAEDRRVKTIRQRNMGRSVARNSGVAEANGSHLMFLDADDYLLKGAVRHALDLTSEGYALVLFPFVSSITPTRLGYSKVTLANATNIALRKMTATGLLRRILNLSADSTDHAELSFYEVNSACSRLYRRDIVSLVRVGRRGGPFPLGVRMSEDRLFNLAYLRLVGSNSVLFDNNPAYFWDLNESRTTSRPSAAEVGDWGQFDEIVNEMIDSGQLSPEEGQSEVTREFKMRFKRTALPGTGGTAELVSLWRSALEGHGNLLAKDFCCYPSQRRDARWLATRLLLQGGHVSTAFRLERSWQLVRFAMRGVARA